MANLISIDSTFITNVGGGIGGGCDPNFPDGFNNIEPISFSLTSSNPYTVPTGKNLYIVSTNGVGGYGIYADGLLIHSANVLADENYLIFGEGDVLTNNAPGGNYFLNFNGYLVDENYFAGCGGGGSSSSNSSSSMISTSIEFNSNLSSGTLGVGSSFSTNVVIDTLEIPANSMVDINGFYNRSGSSYASNTDSQIYFTDLTGNSLSFLTVSSSGFSSNNLSSSIIPNGDGMYVMKKFFSNATTIIIYSSLSGQHCCHAWQYGGGVSFSTSGFITINSY